MATNFNDYLNEQLKDECFKTEYDPLFRAAATDEEYSYIWKYYRTI